MTDITVAPHAAGRYELPELLTVAPDRRTVSSLSEKAYYLLRDRLVTLRIRPGATIDERALQDELEVGRTPVREALRRLADEQLVRVVPRRGMFASHVDLGDLSAISEVRVELEGYAGQLAAKRATGEDRETIAELLREIDDRASSAAGTALMQLDLRTHRLVHKATHNAYLAATLDEYYVHSLRMWFFVLDRVEHLGQAVEEHRELLCAVRDGDSTKAERLLREHIAGFDQAIRPVL